METIVNTLLEEMQKMKVIDSHEHLPREDDLTSKPADIFTRIFCHYSLTGANSAGMLTPREVLMDTTVPLDERWDLFKPYLSAIQDTGYARAAFITARDLYGIDAIDDGSYLELSERIQAQNTKGLYNRVLKERCRIERVLNQGEWDDGPSGYSVKVNRDLIDIDWSDPMAVGDLILSRGSTDEGRPASPREWVETWLSRLVAEGAVGIKLYASIPDVCIDDNGAGRLYRKLSREGLESGETAALGTWLIHKGIELAPDYGLVIAIHCGLVWECWQDFSDASPMGLIPLFLKYRRTAFDLYHGGIPWVREIAVIANQYPNVHLNLVWCHQISPFMTRQMLNEWIDLVPVNKIIGFGGDNVQGPEKTYGVLKMAEENIARALAERVTSGYMTESRAVEVCRLWLYENPVRIYNLNGGQHE